MYRLFFVPLLLLDNIFYLLNYFFFLFCCVTICHWFWLYVFFFFTIYFSIDYYIYTHLKDLYISYLCELFFSSFSFVYFCFVCAKIKKHSVFIIFSFDLQLFVHFIDSFLVMVVFFVFFFLLFMHRVFFICYCCYTLVIQFGFPSCCWRDIFRAIVSSSEFTINRRFRNASKSNFNPTLIQTQRERH